MLPSMQNPGHMHSDLGEGVVEKKIVSEYMVEYENGPRLFDFPGSFLCICFCVAAP